MLKKLNPEEESSYVYQLVDASLEPVEAAIKQELEKFHSKIGYEKQKVELAAKQEVDPITLEKLAGTSPQELILLNGRVYHKKTIAQHIIESLGRENGPCCPVHETPLSIDTLQDLAVDTNLDREAFITQEGEVQHVLIAMGQGIVYRENIASSADSENPDVQDLLADIKQIKQNRNETLRDLGYRYADQLYD